MKRLFHRSKGFTLVELMVVMTIMSILAAIVVPAVTGTTTAGRGTSMTADINTVQNAVERFVGDHPKGNEGGWPTCDGLKPNSGSTPLVWGASFIDKADGKTVRVFGLPASLVLAPDDVADATSGATNVANGGCAAILSTSAAVSTTAVIGASYLRTAIPHAAATRATAGDLTTALNDGTLKIKIKAFADSPNTKLTVTHEITPDTSWAPALSGRAVWRIDSTGKVLVNLANSEY